MAPKVRVVDGPLPTNQDGSVVLSGICWYPGSGYDTKVYVPSLAGGTRPVASGHAHRSKDTLLSIAREVVKRDGDIFRGLAQPVE